MFSKKQMTGCFLVVSCFLLLLSFLVFSTHSSQPCLSTLPKERINDNFCDCLDDEPDTGACSPLGTFSCKGETVAIPSSRVGDSVCDCCDGSDEPITSACTNTCFEKQRKQEEENRAFQALRLSGEAKFREMLSEACEMPTKAAEEEEAHAEKAQLQQDLDQLSSDLEETRVSQLELGKLPPAVLSKLLVQLAAKHPRTQSTLEDLLRKTGLLENPTWAPDTEEIVDLRSRLASFDEEEEKEEEATNAGLIPSDLGPGGVWKKLANQCFSMRAEQYEYKMCVFGDFTQNSVSLGKFSAWGEDHAEFSYTNGAFCHSPGVMRSVKVSLECGLESKLVDIVEPSTCVYQAVFETPAACVPDDFNHEEEGCNAAVE